VFTVDSLPLVTFFKAYCSIDDCDMLMSKATGVSALGNLLELNKIFKC
jgi:hypothetical protein